MVTDRIIDVIPADDESDTEKAFDDFREDLKETETPGKLRVWRLPLNEHNQPVATKTQIILFSCPIDQFRLDEITAKVQQEYFLPGETFMAIRIAGFRQGQGGNAFNRILVIQRGKADTTTAGATAAPAQNDLSAILTAMREDRNAQNSMLQGLFERIATAQNSRPSIDPAAQAERMVTMITGLAGVLTKQPAAVVAGPAGSIKEMVETMVMLRDLSEQMTGGGKGDDNSAARIIEAVTPLAKPMLELMVAGRNAPPRRNPQRLAGPTPQPAPAQKVHIPPVAGVQPLPGDAPTLPPQESSPENDQMLFAQLRPQFDVLAKMASEGADPVVVAQMTLEQLPESADGPIFALLSDPNWLQKFVTINPVVNNHVEWFTKLRDALLAEFDTGDAANG